MGYSSFRVIADLISLLSVLDCCRETLVNNTMIDVLGDRDNCSFSKMTNVMWCDQDWSVSSWRVLVDVGEVSTVVMVVWMILEYSNCQ
jgi:hypothetical protein